MLGLVTQPLRRDIVGTLERISGNGRFPVEQYTDPPGDPGLFGPGSMVWRVHAHPAMLVGGISALMLQTLHPLAMAGVAEHSSYREDPLARLARTSSFVDGTSFASREVAEKLVAIVRAIHGRVRGVAPDGRPYSADDPALLRWVHVAEVDSFVRAYQRYAGRLTPEEVDRYFAEISVVAEMLGATDVPKSRAEVDAYYADVRGHLAAGEQARETYRFILTPPSWHPPIALSHAVIARAAVDLLPEWGRDLIGEVQVPVVEPLVVRALAKGLVGLLAWAAPNPRVQQAYARVGAAAAAAPAA